ncbi:MAG: hypothetical protein J7K40_13615 [candidate division Zixibacteria bacterium]|nr:hypothetical protein [candidate division Zixibacteria bacterium]
MSGSRSSSSGRSSSGTSGREKSRRKISDRWLFFLRFPLFFILAYLIWSYSAPIANKIFTFTGEKVVMLFDANNFTKSMTAKGKYIVVNYAPSPDGKPRVTKYNIYTFNTVFLIALIMAVPGIKYKLRIKILLIGLILLFPIQILRLAIYVFNYYGQNMRIASGERLYPAIVWKTLVYGKRILARLDGQLVPILIWGGLFYYYKWHNIFKKRITS